jgi:hypothetical protein
VALCLPLICCRAPGCRPARCAARDRGKTAAISRFLPSRVLYETNR